MPSQWPWHWGESMKQLIGSDAGSYIFNPAMKTITLSGIPGIKLSNFLVITNVATGTMLFNFADSALGGTYSEGVLTLLTDTSTMSAEDPLQIFIDVPGASTLTDLVVVIRQMINAIIYPPNLDKVQNRTRVMATLESGTVTTVTGLTNIDSYQGRMLIINGNATSWATNVRARFS